MKLKPSNTSKIKLEALELGFSAIGISKADFLEKESSQLKNWLENGFHGKMQYMENHFEKRTDPRKLVEGAKSVISVLLNYYPKDLQIRLILDNHSAHISKELPWQFYFSWG